MAGLKAKKIRQMSEKELNDKLRELRLELSKENATSEIGTVKNPGKIRDVKRSIARILTVKNERKKSS